MYWHTHLSYHKDTGVLQTLLMGRMAYAAGDRCQPVNNSVLDMPEFQLLLWAALEELMASPCGIATSLLAVCSEEWLFPMLRSGILFSTI